MCVVESVCDVDWDLQGLVQNAKFVEVLRAIHRRLNDNQANLQSKFEFSKTSTDPLDLILQYCKHCVHLINIIANRCLLSVLFYFRIGVDFTGALPRVWRVLPVHGGCVVDRCL